MSLVGVVTAVTSTTVAADSSTINEVNVIALLTFPVESVTVIVQFE